MGRTETDGPHGAGTQTPCGPSVSVQFSEVQSVFGGG